MRAKDTLIKNVLIFSVGNLGSRVLVFFLVPLFSFYLTPAEMGYYDLAIITIGLLVPLTTLQLSDGIYRWLLDSNKKSYRQTISSAFLAMSAILLSVSLAFFVLSHFYPIDHGFIIGVYFIVSCLHPFLLAVARGMRKNKLYAISGLVNSAILVGVNWVLLANFSFGLEALFISHIVSTSISILLLIVGSNFLSYVSFQYYSNNVIKSFIKYSLPLIPNAVSWWFINSANRYIILYFLGNESNGIYAMSSRIAMALYAINSIFNLAWQESAITEYNKKDRDRFYSDVFNRYFVLEMSVIILLMPASKIFVLYFVSHEYADSWRYIPFLLLGVGFATFAAFFGTGYLSAKKTVGAFSTTLYGAIVNVFLSIVLVPRFGLFGASVGLAVGFAVTWVWRIFQTESYFNINFNWSRILLISVLVVLSTILIFSTDNIYGLAIFAVGAMGCFIYFNLELFKVLYNKVIPRRLHS